jgi:cytoskeleton protein RodZ
MIRVRYLEALENERFDMLPEGPYLRSFLREYAEFLGLDGDILVTEWMSRLAAAEPELPEAPAPSRVAALLSELPRRRSLIVFLTLVVLTVGFWQLGGTCPSSVQSSPPAGVRHSRPIPAPSPRAKSSSAATTAQRATPSLLLAAARGPCWLLARIRSISGPVVEEHTLQQGQTARFGLKQPLWIRLGAPWNLDASIGNRVVTASLPASTGNVLVTRAGVRSA